MNCYVISDPSGIDMFKSALDGAFNGLTAVEDAHSFILYDTFDWRLYNSGRELIRKGNRFELVQVSKGKVLSGLDDSGKIEKRFCGDFPASDFTAQLEPLLEMRALLPVTEIERKIERLAVCNADEKTVARIEIETSAIKAKEHRVIRCRLLPMKGYGRESREIRAIIKAQHLLPAEGSSAIALLRKSGIDPGGYSSKVDVSLQPEMPAFMAVRLVLKHLVAVMHQNLEGVRKDVDTEFLHDLRVAIRRARSLLGQTKGVFDAETTALLQACLKTMGGVSGRVRDLDVYLLKKDVYVEKVPEALRPGILQLFQSLRRKRRAARNHMLKLMDGDGFVNALKSLDEFLQAESSVPVEGRGLLPIGDLAKTVIYKRFRRIIRKGGRISGETADEKLHELRIDCKKLRYLMEFFASLFPEDQMKRLIKQLKGLQENLGDFNDLSVQQEFLTGYLDAIEQGPPRSLLPAAAVGGLIGGLFADQKQVRSNFLNVFGVFSSAENQAAFKTLFA